MDVITNGAGVTATTSALPRFVTSTTAWQREANPSRIRVIAPALRTADGIAMSTTDMAVCGGYVLGAEATGARGHLVGEDARSTSKFSTSLGPTASPPV